jgi:hypothetical protein
LALNMFVISPSTQKRQFASLNRHWLQHLGMLAYERSIDVHLSIKLTINE